MPATRPLRRLAVLAAILPVGLVVAGCGDGGTTSSTAGASATSATSAVAVPAATITTPATGGASTDREIVTGAASCTLAEITRTVQAAARAQGATATLAPNSFVCADGWAVAAPQIGTGGAAVTVTYLFEAEGQFWIRQERAKVCAAPSPVPAKIRRLACERD